MKIFIETLGCPKNFNDTQTAEGILEKAGVEIAGCPEEADVVMVNTCGFINDAKTESIARIFDMCKYKESGAKLLVSGCLSQRYSEELFAEMPEVDGFIGVNAYERLPEILTALMAGDGRVMEVDELKENESIALKRLPRKLDAGQNYTATLKIAEGCNNCCTYCVIPSIRGDYRSKRQEDVLEEARELAAAGCKELILIAQDVTNYGIDLYGKRTLPSLLKALCRIDGIHWIRLMYCYEDRISDELIKVIQEEPKICHYLDIPIQHASDAVLAAMHRRSTERSIRNTIDRLRRAIPDIHIRTTLIAGFPGETEKDYGKLCGFVEDVRFERLGVFAYSQEENTPAGEMAEQIEEEIKLQRADGIMRRQLDISLAVNQAKIGKVLEVLVEAQEEDGTYVGRTQYDAPEIDNAVVFTATRRHEPGEFVRVKINDAFDYDLAGVEVNDEFTK